MTIYGKDAIKSGYAPPKEVAAMKAEIDSLRELLRQALDSRAPDYAEAAHPGWADRARAALASALRNASR